MAAFAPVLVRWLLLAVVAASLAGWGFMQGVSRESDRRDALALKQKEDQDRAYDRAVWIGAQAAREAIALRQQNRAYYQQLRERIRDVEPQSLVSVECPAVAGPRMPAAPEPDGDPVVLFSPQYVLLHNLAWLGAGATVPADPGRAAADAARAAPADPAEILDHTAREAETCGEDRKRYARLIQLLRQPPWSSIVMHGVN